MRKRLKEYIRNNHENDRKAYKNHLVFQAFTDIQLFEIHR